MHLWRTMGHFIFRRDQSQTLVETKVWHLINMQDVLNHVSRRSSHLSHWQMQKKISAFAVGPWRIRPVTLRRYEATKSFMKYLFCLQLFKWKLKWLFDLILWCQIKLYLHFTFCILIRSHTTLLVSDEIECETRGVVTQLNSTENYGRRCLTPLSPHRNYILS